MTTFTQNVFDNGTSAPLVSVVIPVYRVAPYIRKCVVSLANQTYTNIETIFVDDASPDDSIIVAKRASSKLTNVKTLTLEKNVGLSGARNAGIESANGKYIFFLDSDDWLDETAIEKMVEKAENGAAEVVICDYYRANVNGKLVRAKDRTPYSDANKLVFNPIKNQSALKILNLAQIKLYNRDFILKNDFNFTSNVIYEDVDWTFKVLTTATRVAVIDEPLYFYRTARPGSILNTPGMKHFDVISQYERVFNFLEQTGKTEFFFTIYSYAINAVYAVLIENNRIPPNERANFFNEAKRVFKAAKGKKKFAVTLYNRDWFERALLNKTYKQTLALKNRRQFNARLQKSKRWQAFRNSKLYAGMLAISGALSTAKRFGITRKKALISKIERTAHSFVRILPRQNSIVFESYWGQQFADSPKYIYEYLRKSHPEVRCYFALKKNVIADIPETDRLRWGSYRYYVKLARSKVFVNNNNFSPSFKKPKNGLFIQTFHGIPIKYIGTDMIGYEDGANTNWGALVQRCSMWDYFISAGAHHSEAIRGAFQTNAKFLEIGSPRTDCLQDLTFLQEKRKSIRAHFGLPSDCKIVLYAPTWRLNSSKTTLTDDEISDIINDAPVNTYFLFRQHHLSKEIIKTSERIIDASNYEDSQELCAAANILITDYSSIAFDFAITGNPAIFYIKDYEEYRRARGMYFDMEESMEGLTHRSVESLTTHVSHLLNSEMDARHASNLIRSQFMEAERANSSRLIVENIILPHLAGTEKESSVESLVSSPSSIS